MKGPQVKQYTDTKGEVVQAFRAQYDMDLENFHSKLVAKQGDWVVERESKQLYSLSDEAFRAEYTEVGDGG